MTFLCEQSCIILKLANYVQAPTINTPAYNVHTYVRVHDVGLFFTHVCCLSFKKRQLTSWRRNYRPHWANWFATYKRRDRY